MARRLSLLAASVVLLGGMVSFSGCQTHSSSSVAQDTLLSQPLEQVTIIKSPNDDRTYSALRLDNDLQVVLVSDATSEVAAVSLAVGAGSYQDPNDQAGLAHYLEHMLFLGTEKYPEPNSLQKFIDGNAGMWNAYTARNHTNYFFQLKADQLDQALDYFSDYFRAPTFNPQYSEKERNAVNSEWSMGRTNDSWILYRVAGLTSNPAHPAHRFTTGNLTTLADKPGSSLQDALRQFYQRYYSANNMRLTIVSKQPLAELEALARKHFSSVPNRDITPPRVDLPGLTAAQMGQHIHVKTLKDMKQLVIEYPIQDNTAQWRVKPNGYLHYLISSEEPGTLGQQLRDSGLVNFLSAQVSPDEYGNDGTFRVFIELTEAGLNNKDVIISAVFAYVDLIRRQGVNQGYFRELKAMWEKDFASSDKPAPLQQATHLSERQFKVPVAHLLNADFVYERFDAKAIKDVLKQLTPERARIWHVSHQETADQEIPFYEGRYAVKAFTPDELAHWRKVAKRTRLQLPPANDLFTDKPAPLVKAVHTTPYPVLSQAGVEAWLVHNEHFHDDKGLLEISLNIDFAYDTPEETVAASLLSDIYNARQISLADRAGRAGIYIGLGLSPEKGQSFSLYGYSEKQPLLVEKMMQEYAALEINANELNNLRDRYIKSLINQRKEIPFRQAFSRIGKNLREKGRWDNTELIAVAEKITLEKVRQHHKRVLDNHLLRIYAAGNFTEATIASLAEKAAQTLGSSRLPEQRYTVAIVPPRAGLQQSDTFDVDPTDSALVDLYLSTQQDMNQSAQLRLLNGLFSTDIFTQLRTQEQLGYVVGSFGDHVNDYPMFGLFVQSTNTDLTALKARMDKFRVDYLAVLQSLDPAQLEQLKAAEIAQIQQKPNDYRAEASRHLTDFSAGTFSFDRKARLVAALEKVSKADLIASYKTLVLGKQGQNLVIQARGTHFADKPFAPVK